MSVCFSPYVEKHAESDKSFLELILLHILADGARNGLFNFSINFCGFSTSTKRISVLEYIFCHFYHFTAMRITEPFHSIKYESRQNKLAFILVIGTFRSFESNYIFESESYSLHSCKYQ